MARPIKETPVIKGKDAKKFLANMEQSKSVSVSSQVLERMKKNFQTFSSIEKK